MFKVEDAAGNAASRTMVATPRPKLYQPARDARLRARAPPTFAWEAVPKASYYNFQLHRRVGGRWVGADPLAGEAVVRAPAALEGGRRDDVDRSGRGATAGTSGPRPGCARQRRYGKLEGSSAFSVG